MVVDTYAGYSPADFVNALDSLLSRQHTGYNLTDDEHYYIVSKAGTNYSTAIIDTIDSFGRRDPAVLENHYIQTIYDYAGEIHFYLLLVDKVLEQAPLAGKMYDKSYITRQDNYINTYIQYQEKQDSTYSLERDTESDYLAFNRIMPFIYNIKCLGRIYERGNYRVYDTDTETYSMVGEWGEPEEVVQVTDYVSTAPSHPTERAMGDYDVDFYIIDCDSDNGDLVTETFNYKDRSMTQGGIFTYGSFSSDIPSSQ